MKSVFGVYVRVSVKNDDDKLFEFFESALAAARPAAWLRTKASVAFFFFLGFFKQALRLSDLLCLMTAL